MSVLGSLGQGSVLGQMVVRSVAVLALLGAIACRGGTSDEGEAAGSSGSGGTTMLEDPSSGFESSGSSGEASAECEVAVDCGDGIVSPGEACDDANDNDADGCTATCERPPPDVIATLPMIMAEHGAVDGDGSVIVAIESPPEVVRFAADGREMWRVAIADSQERVNFDSVVLGSDIAVVGAAEESDWIATQWHVAADGTESSSRNDPSFDSYNDAAVASDGGLVLLTDTTVERRARDGTVAWSRALDLPAAGAVGSLAINGDSLAFVAGSVSGGDEALLVRVTPDETTSTPLAPPIFPGTFFEDIAPTPDGGAIAVGSAEGHVVAVRVDAMGDVVSTSTCSTDGLGTVPNGVAVIDTWIVLSGLRTAEPGCIDVCGGYNTAWMQRLGLDGTVVATDDPGPLGSDPRRPTEAVIAVGRTGPGVVTGLVSDWSRETLMIVRFPW